MLEASPFCEHSSDRASKNFTAEIRAGSATGMPLRILRSVLMRSKTTFLSARHRVLALKAHHSMRVNFGHLLERFCRLDNNELWTIAVRMYCRASPARLETRAWSVASFKAWAILKNTIACVWSPSGLPYALILNLSFMQNTTIILFKVNKKNPGARPGCTYAMREESPFRTHSSERHQKKLTAVIRSLRATGSPFWILRSVRMRPRAMLFLLRY